jgi:DNA-binding PadR family transcriptional regulator
LELAASIFLLTRARRPIPKSERLSERSTLVLTSLAGGDKHGYALIKDIESFSGVKLGPGTLYAALARLEREGLIQALPEADRRRPYQITAAGTETLTTRLSETARIAQLGLARIGVASR